MADDLTAAMQAIERVGMEGADTWQRIREWAEYWKRHGPPHDITRQIQLGDRCEQCDG